MSDATPAYRGYRLQTLYTLGRILEPNESRNLIFQPEGAEDFAIWDTSDHLLETVQVKAYSANLTLSLFSPEKADSFLYRADGLLCIYPDMRIKIASFGDIEGELLRATQEDGKDRAEVARKVSEKNFLSEIDARRLLNQLQIVSVVESEVEARVLTALQSFCTGIDPVPAFEMLNFWLYLCAENKSKIAQNNVIQRINDVGRFLAERNAHHNEWFRSIIPIENNEVNAQAREKLSDEFYRGISARYDHILAEVDKPRISKLNEIAQKFREKQVVIVHGASGQGKTTIAYRYLHDFFPNQWRFQVRLVENRQQAINIATALSGQAKAIGIPIAVYLDVSPSDIGWDELVKQLSSLKNIQILVTVREEDFRRASISGAEIQFAEVELQFNRLEAEEIYKFLAEIETPNRFLDFENAWNRFGGSGPLMEFVYLVTQGNSLRERLQQQVRRLQDEVRAGKCSDVELEMLRLVSVASAFEARLKLKELVRFLQLPAPQRTLELLEEEYLLRTSEDGTLVGGLHPIRSTILSDILTDPTFYPWADSASTCLPLIFEQDVGSFLLYSFSRHRHELEPLLFALNTFQPRHWIAIAGITRALIWLGIKEYVEENRQLIDDTYEFISHSWAFFLDSDITDASPGALGNLQSDLMPCLSEDRQTQINDFRNRQTDKTQVFSRSARWLSHLTNEPIPPHAELDWTEMGEVLFWAGWLQISLPISDWLAQVELNTAVETLPLEILADVALGLFYGDKLAYYSWLDTNYIILLRRFRHEIQIVELEDDGQNLRAHFLVELIQSDAFLSEAQAQKDIPKAKDVFKASMERLRLLRRFFPDRELYGNQGYGHLLLNNVKLDDETQKNIPYFNIPLQRLTAINATFIALGEQKLRLHTWEAYVQVVVELRRTNLQILKQLSRGLAVYFREKKTTQILGKSLKSDLWIQGKNLLKFSPFLPCCAFDEWGFFTENIDRVSENSVNVPYQNQNLALEKYKPYIIIFNEYVCKFSNFLDQAESVLNFHPSFRRGENARVQEIVQILNINLRQQAHLSVLNLGDVCKSLPKLQEEFRKLLTPFIRSKELNDLERLEQETFNSLWYLWYFFAFHPSQQFQNAKQDCSQLFNNKVSEIRNSIRRELYTISLNNIDVSILSENVYWDEERALWIKIDGVDVFEVYSGLEPVVAAIQRAINSIHSDELRRYTIDFTWSNIVILPLIRGKSLDATAWQFASNFFSVNPDQELGWWNFVPVAIPSNAFSQLTLSTWSYPRLIIVQKLMGLVYQLSLLASHIRDFERLPELDEQGNELLQQYFQQFTLPLGETFQAVFDIEIEIFSYFTNLTSPEQNNRPHLIKAMLVLGELHEQIWPMADCNKDEKIEVSMNCIQLIEWANQLNTVQQLAFSMYLFWVSDVMEETSAIETAN
jgi:hypothetical protein